MMIVPSWTPPQVICLVLGILALVGGSVVALVSILTDRRLREAALRVRAQTTSEMIAKGYGVEEIESTLAKLEVRPVDLGSTGPAPCDIVTVDGRGNVTRALILAASIEGGQFLVHHVGKGIDRNEWLPRERCLFPASFDLDSFDDPAQPFPFARPAAVEREGEWSSAYIVARGAKSLAYFVGEEWHDSEWVEEERIRYAAPGARADGKVVSKPDPLDI